MAESTKSIVNHARYKNSSFVYTTDRGRPMRLDRKRRNAKVFSQILIGGVGDAARSANTLQ